MLHRAFGLDRIDGLSGLKIWPRSASLPQLIHEAGAVILRVEPDGIGCQAGREVGERVIEVSRIVDLRWVVELVFMKVND